MSDLPSARIVALSGSLRQASFNGGLVQAAAGLYPRHIDPQSIRGIPLYDGDLEQREGLPEAVKALKDAIAGADGLLLSTPEYNNSMPGVLKNAIDWLTRPPADSARVFAGKAVAVTGVTRGGFGTILAQDAWLPVLRALRTRPYFGGRLLISGAEKLFEADGSLADDDTRERLRQYLQGFIRFAAG